MARTDPAEGRLPRGVTALPRARGGRRYRARIRHGKGGEVHLGLYATPALAAFAYNVAAQAIRRAGAPPNEIPRAEQPTADQVVQITARVRRRLGLDRAPPLPDDAPPGRDALLTLFEVAVVGFWRDQAAAPDAGQAGGLDAAARRLVEAARCLFWCPSAGHPTPLEAMTDLLAHRLDRTFRRADLARAILDDDGDEEFRVARWLVHPDAFPGGAGRGFRAEVMHLYAECFRDNDAGPASAEALPWADILGVRPPFSREQVRRAYRARSRTAHPDAGGSPEEFVRLRRAFEAARRYCEASEA